MAEGIDLVPPLGLPRVSRGRWIKTKWRIKSWPDFSRLSSSRSTVVYFSGRLRPLPRYLRGIQPRRRSEPRVPANSVFAELYVQGLGVAEGREAGAQRKIRGRKGGEAK